MKKLLLLLLLFGFSAIGADRPIISSTGLEGIAEYGINITVEDYSNKDKDFDKKAIGNQVRLRLLQAGIKFNHDANTFLVINAQPVISGKELVGYSLSIGARRIVEFNVNGKKYRKFATVWSKGGLVPPKLRDAINEDMDQFLLDYLKANPKKKEE